MSNETGALYGLDLFGDAVVPPSRGKLSDDFIIPPFSVLSAREGFWQERKRAWISYGIKSEVGRGDRKDTSFAKADYFNKGKDTAKGGGSVFDPVICELIYRWFCPDGGQVVDPFAGGSVRGIVAHILGRKYWGCDLRQEQIDANIQQAIDIIGQIPGTTVDVNVSVPMLKQKFQPCTADYIKDTCVGRCCEGTGGIMVTIHKTEEARIKSLGADVKDGMIVPDNGLCPFKTPEGLCSIHGDQKPFGCKASPFTLNANGTLIIRNRYRCMKCYDTDDAVPAYEAHKWSLEQIFGVAETAYIISTIKGGEEKQVKAKMSRAHYDILIDNDAAKKGNFRVGEGPVWVCGDSMDEMENAPDADLLFSCPPYGDLEVYSNDSRDISNMEYHTFVAAYKRIIMRSCARLKNNRFACFVVGDFRDKKGFYRNFVSDTIGAFLEQGLHLYNEAILLTPTGSLPIRGGRQFRISRKMGKAHQNILIFVKGDPKVATQALEPIPDI